MGGTPRVAFDIGGVISKYPAIMRALASALVAGGAEVFVITDMRDHASVLEILSSNGFGFIPGGNVRCAEYDLYGEGCKAELLRDLQIDIIMDDHPGYVTAGGCPVRCLVMPDASLPYYSDDWKMPAGGGNFGRVSYRKG